MFFNKIKKTTHHIKFKRIQLIKLEYDVICSSNVLGFSLLVLLLYCLL